MNILIIDDDEDTSLLLETILKYEGYDGIVTVNSGQAALNLLDIGGNNKDAAEVDLILLDVIMPDINGIDTCSAIKSNEEYQDVPIIMVTGDTEDDTLKKAFDAGAIDFITKPFKEVELLARIRSALRLKGEIDRRKERESELLHVTSLLGEAVSNLQKISLTDGMTGLTNRRGFDEQLISEFQRLSRKNYMNDNVEAISLILLDVDQFKQFNDIYGHVEGDHCLQQVACILMQETKRPGDTAARYGGEEFVVLLPETTGEDAMIVAERMRVAIEGLQIPHSHSKVSSFVTVSLGVSWLYPMEETSADFLVTSADQALYKAKTTGRNRVHMYSEQENLSEGLSR
ncbi:diguanylate cyclase [Cohnella silvisoli]|uniref:Diguanylate cyclase n=1 Tax=Cohnella silvisoli TaxID=2873699 RepID=A0ABV1KSH1_9BACL|nr:diguanylate cyclase [Cohnella silvisoli]MCD9024603.1 diguanylate cyclase [Cohnella silvisoli]